MVLPYVQFLEATDTQKKKKKKKVGGRGGRKRKKDPEWSIAKSPPGQCLQASASVESVLNFLMSL